MKKIMMEWLQQQTAKFSKRQWKTAIVLFSILWSIASCWVIYYAFYRPAVLSIEHLHRPVPTTSDSLLLLEKIYQQKQH